MPDSRLQRTRENYWERPTRYDVLYGVALIRPEFAVRIAPMTVMERVWAWIHGVRDFLFGR